MSEKLVDARGLSCPEPVLMTQDALKECAGAEFAVAVSSPTARDNVEGLLQSKGRKTRIDETKDGWNVIALEG